MSEIWIIFASELLTDRHEELESMVLSVLRLILSREPLESTSKYFFLYELLEALLCYEKTIEDYDKIKQSVYHPMNKYHLGESFFLKIKREDCWNK